MILRLELDWSEPSRDSKEDGKLRTMEEMIEFVQFKWLITRRVVVWFIIASSLRTHALCVRVTRCVCVHWPVKKNIRSRLLPQKKKNKFMTVEKTRRAPWMRWMERKSIVTFFFSQFFVDSLVFIFCWCLLWVRVRLHEEAAVVIERHQQQQNAEHETSLLNVAQKGRRRRRRRRWEKRRRRRRGPLTSLLSSGEKERERKKEHILLSLMHKKWEKKINVLILTWCGFLSQSGWGNGNPSLFLSLSSKWLLRLLLLLFLLLLRGDEVGNQSHRGSSAVP